MEPLPSFSGVLVEPAEITVTSVRIGALPLVNMVLERLGLLGALEAHLPTPDRRSAITSATALRVLICNLCVARQPLYALGSWAAGYAPGLLGLGNSRAARVNDDRVGRALDQLFCADRASLLTELTLRAVRRWGIDVSELHNDSTSITLYGSYRRAIGTPRGGNVPPIPQRGHSKDHRPDLLQLVEILTVSADATIPIAHRLVDGSTEDSTTHEHTWDQLAAMFGASSFVYVADSKLATRDNLDHIAVGAGRFLTILPRTRKEDRTGRAWIATGAPAWEEISRSPGRRKTDPDRIYWAVEAPACSAEGYRIVWIRSSDKRSRDAEARRDRIERALAGLAALADTLTSKRCRLKSATAVETAANTILDDTGTTRWIDINVTDTVSHEHRQEHRGRPGPSTRYHRIDHHHFALTYRTNPDTVNTDAASDGCFPFITNENCTATQLLTIYKAQPHLERRHATFKGVIKAAPLTLKNDTRLDALALCLYIALLVHALIERDLRQAMATHHINSLPLYHENRACTAPTAARVIEILEPLSATIVTHAGQPLTITPPIPDPLQQQLLTLLNIPATAYQQPPLQVPARTTP